MIDQYTQVKDYATCYADKSRITFIEKYFYTFNAMKGKKLPFVTFPRQKAFLKALADNRNIVAVKPRQCGISTLSSAWIAAECAFASKDTPITVLCIANKLDQAGELIIKIRDFLEMVPRWYWGDDFYSPDPKSDKNKESIFVKNTKSQLDLFNGCRIIARASGPNAARGISAVSVLLMDEAAFIEEGVAAYTTASATMASNPKSKTIMVSTPFGHDELYYNTYMQALSHENNFVAVQFRWYQDPRFNKNLKWYKKNETTNETKWDIDPVIEEDGSIKYDEERWEKLVHDGYTPTSPWYEDMCKQFNNDSMKIAQELDVSFLGSADNVVAQKFIDMQEKLNVREPLTEMSDPLVDETWFWKPPIDEHKYLISVDPSRGVSADRTGIVVIDMDGEDENGEPIIEEVMEYCGKKLGDEIGGMVFNYAKLYNDAFVVVDCTGGQGDAVVLTLIQLGYKNMYYEDMSQKMYTVQNLTRNQDGYTDKLPGFHFQGNRYPVLSNFASMVRFNEVKIRSQRVINELQTWVFDKSGKMNHQNGSHDDLICAFAMALFVMRYTVNRIERTVSKDKAILAAYMTQRKVGVRENNYKEGMAVSDTSKKYALPFYKPGGNTNTNTVFMNGPNSNYMWLFK